MDRQRLGCCAIYELRNIYQHAKEPEKTILAFCKMVWPQTALSVNKPIITERQLCAFVVFSGVVDYLNEREKNVPPYDPVAAPLLEKYILDNDLGELVMCPPKPNRQNSPDHIIKPYIWMPRAKTLMKWFKKEMKKKCNQPPVVQPILQNPAPGGVYLNG